VVLMGTGIGWASGSIEGRIAVEYFDADPAAQSQKYAFRAHRQTVDGVDCVYPINALAYHPVYVSSPSYLAPSPFSLLPSSCSGGVSRRTWLMPGHRQTQHLRIGRIRRLHLHLGPFRQEADEAVPQVPHSDLCACLQSGWEQARNRSEL